MPRLSEQEFLRTFTAPMRLLPPDREPPFDFWPYFETIPEVDFEARDCSEGRVPHVYVDASGRYQHVLVASDDQNVFMVLVLDLNAGSVVGHRLLDLRREYGL